MLHIHTEQHCLYFPFTICRQMRCMLGSWGSTRSYRIEIITLVSFNTLQDCLCLFLYLQADALHTRQLGQH
jgi:hypothetical protein